MLTFACNGNAIVSRSSPSKTVLVAYLRLSFHFVLLSRWVRWLSIFPVALSAGDDTRAARVMRWDSQKRFDWRSHLWVLFKPWTLMGVMSHFEDERLKDWKSLSQFCVRAQKHDLQVLQMSGQVLVVSSGWSFDPIVLHPKIMAGHSVSDAEDDTVLSWVILFINSYDSFYHALQVSWHSCLHSKSVIFGPLFYWLPLLVSLSPLPVPPCWPCNGTLVKDSVPSCSLSRLIWHTTKCWVTFPSIHTEWHVIML